MGSRLNPGRFDCQDKAADDEPTFTLLARDKHAASLVWMWAALRAIDGEDPDVVAEARQCVIDMMNWGIQNDRQSVGLGQAILAGVMELMACVNQMQTLLGDHHLNQMTDIDVVRKFLASSEYEHPEGDHVDGVHGESR